MKTKRYSLILLGLAGAALALYLGIQTCNANPIAIDDEPAVKITPKAEKLSDAKVVDAAIAEFRKVFEKADEAMVKDLPSPDSGEKTLVIYKDGKRFVYAMPKANRRSWSRSQLDVSSLFRNGIERSEYFLYLPKFNKITSVDNIKYEINFLTRHASDNEPVIAYAIRFPDEYLRTKNKIRPEFNDNDF